MIEKKVSKASWTCIAVNGHMLTPQTADTCSGLTKPRTPAQPLNRGHLLNPETADTCPAPKQQTLVHRMDYELNTPNINKALATLRVKRLVGKTVSNHHFL